MSLIKYCEGCRWNNGCFNTACRMCYCGSKYESLKAQFQQEQVIKHNDVLDSMAYVITARGNGKSSYLYEKMKQAIEEGANICMVRQNGKTVTENDIRKLKEEINMAFGNLYKLPEIKNVVFNDPATIVFWNDDTKTVVKAHNEEFDPEKGLAMAICKKVLGNKGNFNNLFKKWLPEEKIISDDVIDAFNKIMNESEESESKKCAEVGQAAAEGIQLGLASSVHTATIGIKDYIDDALTALFGEPNPVAKNYTVKMLAEEKGVSESTIRRGIAMGLYPGAYKQDGAWIIPYRFMKK